MGRTRRVDSEEQRFARREGPQTAAADRTHRVAPKDILSEVRLLGKNSGNNYTRVLLLRVVLSANSSSGTDMAIA